MLVKTPSLSCSSYLSNIDRLTPAAIDEISFRMAQRLIAQGHSPSSITDAGAHFASPLNGNHVTEFLKVKLSGFAGTYTTENIEKMCAYLSPMTVMGVGGIVVIAYNKPAEQGQCAECRCCSLSASISEKDARGSMGKGRVRCLCDCHSPSGGTTSP